MTKKHIFGYLLIRRFIKQASSRVLKKDFDLTLIVHLRKEVTFSEIAFITSPINVFLVTSFSDSKLISFFLILEIKCGHIFDDVLVA